MANRIVLELLADSNPLLKGLDRAQRNMDRFMRSADAVGASLGSGVNRALDTFRGLADGGANAAGALAGAFAVAATAAFTMTVQAGKVAEQTEMLAQKTGIAAASLEGMSVVMARTGIEAPRIAQAIGTLSRHMGEIDTGTSAGVRALRELGITMETVEAGTGTTMRAIADAFARMPDGADKARIAMDLFGQVGLDLIPILNQGSAGIDAAMQKSAEFGLILSDTARGSLSAFDDAMDDLQLALKGFATQVGVAFAPSLTALVNWFTQAIITAKDMFNKFSDAAETLTIRLSGMVTSLELIGKQLFSTSALSAEAWAQTMEQVTAIDAWATAERQRVATMREAESELATLAERQMTAAAAAEAHAASQQQLGENIVKTTQAQLSQAEALSKQIFQGIFDAEEAASKASYLAGPDTNFLDSGQREQLMGKTIIANYQARQRASQQVVDLLQAEEDAVHARFLAEIEAEGQAQEALGRYIVEQTQAAMQVKSVWAITMEQMAQSGQQAFGMIRNSFGQAVAGMALGTATFRQFMDSMYSTLINSTVQFGINMALQWAQQAATATAMKSAEATAVVGINTAKNAAIVAGDAAGAGATVSIWGGAGAAMVGLFGTITGAIQGLIMGTIFPALVETGGAVVTFLSGIASALDSSVVGAPFSIPVWAAVALVGAAIGTIAAFAFKDGGIVTGPTMGLIGEAGSNEAVIPLNSRGAAFMREAFGGMGGGNRPIQNRIYLDGREIAVALSDRQPSALRLMGALS